MDQTLKEMRMRGKLTQKKTAELLGVSLRTYKTYENDVEKRDTLKYHYLKQELEKLVHVDETHGILSKDEIAQMCEEIFREYPITYCYLFGSYAKGKARETSDVDLLISSELKGIKFYGLVEKIKNRLSKNVDVLSSDQLINNQKLMDEILKDGIKIYG
jgi:predicted nucleotidyltransferase/DNA-binding CsgD family transcriptional regulator